MNDVRKLMNTLRGDVEYREFTTPAVPAARSGGWALLDRLDRAAPKSAASVEPLVIEPIVAEAPPAPEPEPVLATQMRAAAAARSERGQGRLRLGKYASAGAAAQTSSEAQDGRKLPLEAVFARLAQGAR